MSVKIEDLKQAIPDLTEDNYKAIQVHLDSVNSKLYSRIENDIFEVTGIKKNENERYFDYQKRAVKDKIALESKGDKAELIMGLERKLNDHRNTIKDLETKIRDGATGSTKAEIEKLTKELNIKKTDIKNLKDQLTKAGEAHKLELDEKEKGYKSELKDMIVSGIEKQYEEALEKNERLDSRMRDILKREVSVKAKEFDLVPENGMVLLKKEGAQQYIDNTTMLTLDKFYEQELKDYIDIGGKTGITGKPDDKTGSGIIAGAKTKDEAIKLIVTHMETNLGIDKNTSGYNSKLSELAKEAGVDDLA